MYIEVNNTQSATAQAPEELLAQLIEREIGVKIDKHALRILVRSKWSRIAALAHCIHDDRLSACAGTVTWIGETA